LESAITQLEGEFIDPALLTGPLISGEVAVATDNAVTSTNALSLHWQPRRWLPIDATGGINTEQRTDVAYIPYGINYAELGANIDTTGFYGLGRGTSHDQTLTLGTAIPLPHLTLALGGNAYSESTADFEISTDQLAPGVSSPTTFQTCNGTVCTPEAATQQTAGQSTYGWYVEPRLNFASRFFAAPGFRLDGGSGGTRTTTSSGGISGLSAFPKIDLSYVAVDRQSQRPLWGFLTLLRPRLALGLAGTQPGPADKLRLFNVGAYTLAAPGTSGGSGTFGSLTSTIGCQPTVTLDNQTEVPAVCLNALGNTQLQPERTTELEGGVDATLWQGRISLTYTQYDKTRHDAILDIPVAPSVGGGHLEHV
jgi:outer membrane receptor protein involved in Fe transport